MPNPNKWLCHSPCPSPVGATTTSPARGMALLHAAPKSPLPTGNHRQNTGSTLRRPAPVHSRPRRFRLHAQKGTPSGSESDNVVLKAAWYASEALGVAASFFRPPSPEGGAGGATDDEGAPDQSLSTLGRAQVVEAIKDDFARSYFVTGNLTLRAYEDECEFADPAGSFRGLQRFKRNCTNFGSLLEKSDMKLTKWEDLQDKSIGHWRFSCVMSFPWRPILSATGYTEYYFDAESGKVCRCSCCSGTSRTGTSPRWHSCGRFSGRADGHGRNAKNVGAQIYLDPAGPTKHREYISKRYTRRNAHARVAQYS